MATSAIIGALRITLGGDASDLDKTLRGAHSSLASFGKSIATIAGGIGLERVVQNVARGITDSFKQGFEDADKYGKLAQSSGQTVEEFSKLAYAAKLSDVEVEELSKSIGKLSKNMSAIGGGATNEASQALKSMGLSIFDANGKMKTSGELIGDVAEKFSGYEDSANKTALAIALFGRSGAAMIPLLNGGRDALREAKDEAAQLGMEIGTNTAKAAEQFNDNLTRLGKTKDGIIMQVTARMAPAFANLSDELLKAAKSGGNLESATNNLMAAIKGAVSVGYTGVFVFRRLGAELGALWSAIAAPNWEAMKTGWANFTWEGQKTEAEFKSIGTTLAQFWRNSAGGADAATTKIINFGEGTAAFWGGVKAAGDDAVYSLGDHVRKSADLMKVIQDNFKASAPAIPTATKNALQSFIDASKKSAEASKAEAGAIGQSAVEMEKAKITAQGLAVAEAAHLPITAALRAEITKAAGEQAKWNVAAQVGKQVFEATRTPAEAFGTEIERLNFALQNGAINADTYARGVAQAQQKLVEANPHARNLGTALENTFSKALDGGTSFGDLMKSMIKDLIKMEATTAFKTLLYGPQTAGSTATGLIGSIFYSPKWGLT